MDIIKIIGIGLISLIIIIIVKQYRPEFVIYVSIIAGAIILMLIMDKVSSIINLGFVRNPDLRDWSAWRSWYSTQAVSP